MSVRQIIGVAAAACVACCVGPIVGVLGAVAAAGVLSTIWIGLVGVTTALAAITTLIDDVCCRRRCQPVNRGEACRGVRS
jgi:hypothetical protein